MNQEGEQRPLRKHAETDFNLQATGNHEKRLNRRDDIIRFLHFRKPTLCHVMENELETMRMKGKDTS